MTNGRKKHATISDVARQAGVSPAVVSRILNSDTTLRVREDTRKRVLRVVRELDYSPNGMARGLRLSTSGALGLVMHDLGNPLHAETVQGAQSSSSANGYVLLLADAKELVSNPTAVNELMSSRRIDGAILHLSGQPIDDSLQELTKGQLPTVVINSATQTASGSVVLQDEEAAEVATNHLLELGHTEIGFLRALSRSPQGERRLRGIRQAMTHAELELRERWSPEAGFDPPGGKKAMRRLLAEKTRPTAVVVANVMAAIGALEGAREAGVRIPEDMSIVAIHDTWMANHTSPPLTTVKLPLYELGEIAVRILMDVLDDDVQQNIVVDDRPPHVIARGSTLACYP